MSPRSTEFLDAAHRRLAMARRGLGVDPASVVSLAYYAMLYAARAGLSERDLYAKTHGGTWYLFRDTFVLTDQFDGALAAAVQKTQPDRERADYEAWAATDADAEAIVELAARFIAAVEAMFG
jgi:uncharacterized protein (UPF0332 family)